MQGENRPGFAFGGFAVLEVGDIEAGEAVVEELEHRAGTFGDTDLERFASAAASASGLSDETEFEEGDVGSAKHDEDAFAIELFTVLEHGSESHRSGGFGDAAQAFPEDAYGLADFGVGDRFDAVETVLADLKRERACLSNSGAVAEQIDLIKGDFAPGFDGGRLCNRASIAPSPASNSAMLYRFQPKATPRVACSNG